MDPKKISVVIVLEATLGGTRKHVVDLLRQLPSERFDVILVYAMKRADERFKSDVLQLKKEGFHAIELPMTRRLYHPSNLVSILQLIFLLRKHKTKVLHLHGAVAGFIGRVAARLVKTVGKVIYSPHGGVMHKLKQNKLGNFYLWIERKLVTRNLFFVAVSSDEREKLHSYLGISLERIALVPNGIDVKKYTEQEKYDQREIDRQRERLGLKQNNFVLLYPALFLEAKGHLPFFETFLKHGLTLNPDVHILLAGDGPLRNHVERLVESTLFRDQLHFLGFVKNVDMYFQLADAVLLPSVNEAFGYVLLEAMVFKKPIFATRVGGITDIVVDRVNGYLYGPNNLAQLINDINNYPAKLEALPHTGTAAYDQILAQFDLSQISAKIQSLYKD